jgi:hypothetical protein
MEHGMHSSDNEHRIREPVKDVSPALPPSETADLSGAGEATSLPALQTRNPAAGVLFGGFVGIVMGALVGAACCWLVQKHDYLWHGALVGALIGSFGGAVIGTKERKARGEFVRSDLATIIGIVYGLLPALQTLLMGFGMVRGSFTAYLLLGILCIGPTVGLVIGALLDRAYEAGQQGAWRGAIGSIVVAVAACIGVGVLMERTNRPIDPKDLAENIKALIRSNWSDKRSLRGATIQNITLVNDGGGMYSGIAEATIDKQAVKMSLSVYIASNGDITFSSECKANSEASIEWPGNPNFRGIVRPAPTH